MANIKKQDKDIKEAAIKKALINSLTLYNPGFSNFSLVLPDNLTDSSDKHIYQRFHDELSKLVKIFFEIVEVVEKIVKVDTPHFKLVDTEDEKKPKIIMSTELGKQLLQLLEQQTSHKTHHYFEGINIHHYLQLWLNATKEITIETLQKETKDKTDNIEERFASLEQVINTIRDCAKQSINNKSLNIAIKDRRDTVQKNYRKLAEYITYLRALYPQLQIARVELNYNPTPPPKTLANYEGTPAPEIIENQYLEAKQHRKDFLHALKNPQKYTKLFGRELSRPIDMVGFAWKLKYTPYKKFYYELLMFYDISAEPLLNLHRWLSYHWQTVTKKLGSFQCKIIQQDKKNKATYTRPKQMEIKAFLEQAMISLTLTDKYVYYTPAFDKPSHDKTFDKGKPSVYYRTRLINKVKRIKSAKKSR